MAVPLFIFASTACRSIENGLHPQKQLQKYLDIENTNATQIKKTYLPVLQQLLRDDEDESKEILQEFRDIIGVIILLNTPLLIDSLTLLLQKPTHKISDLLDFLHSVLNVPSNTNTPVRILRLLFRDFLLSIESDFCVDEKATHRQIALHCLRIMDNRLKRNICDLPSYGIESSSSLDETTKIWDMVTGTQRQTLEGHSSWVNSVAFSPDGLTLASGSSDKIIIWDMATGTVTQRQTLEGHSDWVNSMVFPPNGLTLISGSSDNTIKIWDMATSTQRQTLEGHSNSVHSIAFSLDRLTLASGSSDNTIKIWDMATGTVTQRQTLEGHSNWVNSMAFSPDGLTLASGSGDKIISWDMATGTQRQTLEGHLDSVTSIAFYLDRLTPALEKAPGNFQLTISGNWICLKDENLLWLPAEYRSFTCQAVKDGTLALGYEDGRVLVLGFRTRTM
ncbi:hypothetical protein N7486_009966 [Penicillium sp. IBT 16267x]|nr:hypothetical protein N7486_009966 [Penicillium sp. IBT 16267x]